MVEITTTGWSGLGNSSLVWPAANHHHPCVVVETPVPCSSLIGPLCWTLWLVDFFLFFILQEYQYKIDFNGSWTMPLSFIIIMCVTDIHRYYNTVRYLYLYSFNHSNYDHLHSTLSTDLVWTICPSRWPHRYCADTPFLLPSLSTFVDTGTNRNLCIYFFYFRIY